MQMKILVQNRRALHDYRLIESFEAGLLLKGSEVKSLRAHKASLEGAFIVHHEGELFLHHAHIHEYEPARHFGHTPLRQRKILLRRRQINKIIGSITRKGMTAIPLKIFLNDRSLIKVDLALAVGTKKEDKRHAIKAKEWARIQHRVLKQSHTL